MAPSAPVPLEGPLPKICVFDLDYTLWPLWCDTHVTPPVKRKGKGDINKVFDRYGEQVSFYAEVPNLLLQLHHSQVQVWAASRTQAPPVARQILSELLIEGSLREKPSDNPLKARDADKGVISAISLFDGMEIYPGSKMEHFREIHQKTGVAYEDMLFFDDESRNREVKKLGVEFVLVPNEGTTLQLFETGLAAWRKARGS
ncbi:hypothetical protein JCM10207_003043 [Rhodosporidiobolus poonsookiae]